MPLSAQPPDPPLEANAAPRTPRTQETDEPALSAADARRLAGETLHQLEAESDAAKEQTLLEEANRLIEIVSKNNPDDPWLLFLTGWRSVLTGRANDAHDRLRRFVETPAGRAEWRSFRLLGDLFVTEFPSLARSNYDKASALNPTAPSVLFGQSLCAARLGGAKRAIALARDAVSGDGGNTIRYRTHLATLLRADGQFDEALQQARRSLALAETRAEASPQGTAALSVIDVQYQLLISIVQARINMADGKSAADFITLADYVRRRGRLAGRVAMREALRVLKTGVDETEPDTPVSLLEAYGAALGEQGRTEEAIDVFERVLQLAPDSSVAAAWLLRLKAEPSPASRVMQP